MKDARVLRAICGRMNFTKKYQDTKEMIVIKNINQIENNNNDGRQ